MITFTDGVADALHRHLALVPPERGAALLGLGDLVTLAVLDSAGGSTHASWEISSELGAAVRDLESAGAGTLLGTVHSHPDGYPYPSDLDLEATGRTLRLNPHLERLVVAVVSRGRPADAHQLALGRDHRLTVTLVRRDGEGHAVVPAATRVVPIAEPLGAARVEVVSALDVRSWARDPKRAAATLPQVGRLFDSERLLIPVRGGYLIGISADYPDAGPLLAHARGGRMVRASLPWDPSRPADVQLRVAAQRIVGTAPSPAATLNAPLLGDLTERRVIVVGAGPVGGRIAEDLARAGVGRIEVVDPAFVDEVEVLRSGCTADDVGERRTSALARRLSECAPGTVVTEHPHSAAYVDLRALLNGSDLLVAATETPEELLFVAHHAYAAGVPTVSCAWLSGADAGQIVVAVPAAGTPCVACARGEATTRERFRPADYRSRGRSSPAPGLGPAIHLIASAAALMCLAVLAPPGFPATRPLREAIATGRTATIVSTSSRSDGFAHPTRDVQREPAPRSVWLTVQREPECIVCGHPDARVAAPDLRIGT